MEFTREQKLAFTADRHLVISANAGSGKTRILVERFLQILEHESTLNDNPENIIAITFTKKAASEMFARIISSLGKMIQNEKDPDKRYRFRRIRSRIFQAKVSTIHSFCSSLLRDYAVEADISPNFQELSETDKYILYKDAKFNAIENMIVDETDPKSKDFREFLSRNKMYLIESIIETILANRYEYMQMKELFADDNFNPLTAKENHYLIHSVFAKYRRGINILLNCLESVNSEVLKPKEQEQLDHIKALVLPIEDEINQYDQNPLASLTSSMSMIPMKEKIGRSIWYNFIISKVNISSKDKELVDSTISFIKDNLSSFTNTEANEAFPELQRTIYHFIDSLLEIADREKEEKGMLDFDDLILRAKSLLSDPIIRDMVMANVNHIMVDEFQDTNQLQYDILQDLIPELKDYNSDTESDANLFIVGDGKQSIYAFRNADVRVFNAASARIAEVNSKKMAEGKLPVNMINFEGTHLDFINNENNGLLSLNASFRLSPVVAAFVNKICGSIMDSSLSEFEVAYEDLVFAKNSSAIKDEIVQRFPHYIFDKPNQIFESDKDRHGSVALVIHKDEKDTEAEEQEESADKLEATKLIRYIKSKIEGNDPYQIFDNGSFRDAKYKDVGILIRSRSKLSELMNACIEEKVPYALHAGSGLYQLQEVQDMIALLKFLYNPNDDIACIGTLRSPFFAISDKELYNISQAEKYDCFWNKAIKYSESEKASEYFAEAFKYIKDILAVSGRLSPTELISKLIYDRAYFEKISNDDAIDQIKASVNKFIAHIRGFEEKGFADIYDLMQELNLLLDISNDGEASVSSENAINIMTFHASKGLEFPVVALFGTNNKTGKPSSVYFNKNFGIAFKDKKVNNNSGLLEQEDNIYTLISKELKNQAEEAEDKRLLYVALTRAKDHLIISANVSYTSKKQVNLQSFAKSIFNVLFGANTEDYSPEKLYEILYNSEIPQINITRQDISFLESNELNNMLIAYNIPCIYEVEQDEITENEAPDNNTEEREESAFIPASYHNEVFSASKIMSYRTDPADYEMKYLVGLSPKNKYFNPDNDKANDELSGNILGIHIHEAMAQLNSWWQDKQIDKEALESIISVLLKRQNLYNEDNLLKVTEICESIVNTEYIQAHQEQLKDGQFELELNIPVGLHYLTGSIDCLVKDSNGNMIIWDWKTNKIADYNTITSLAEHYKHQMSIYAYLVYLMNKNQETYTAQLLFTDYADRSDNNNWVYSFEWSKEEIIEIGKIMDDTIEELSKKYY